ncbi:PepSY domain-containing protein [Rubrivivax sp. RP6-9]|uniref:PepSY domain-containing protein n=1 Tax=Rubrivivax sp. RP6-9 TaxID=3415750 RepID=UPI003CC58434
MTPIHTLPPWRHRLPALLLCALAAAVPGPAAQASDRHDHERARAAVQAGDVLPLAVLLERLQRTHPGQVLELELERDDDAPTSGARWIYEIKLLQASGQLLKLEVDAATGRVLEARRKRADRHGPAQGAPR